MKVTFNIEYRTHWGENLFLNYSVDGGAVTKEPMTTTDGVIWTAEPDLPDATINYYYVVEENDRVTRREYPFGDHQFTVDSSKRMDIVIDDNWTDLRIAGTLVPVFSLRSRRSFGVGDFGDLRMMIDWAALTGQRLVQILPINDTTLTHTWTDSYPYSCISVFALHPQYIDLSALPALKDAEARRRFEDIRMQLNELSQIDYEEVNRHKMAYLRLLFDQEGKRVLASPEFKAFFAETEQWLVPYAYYCHLRDSVGTADFSQWLGHETWNEADRKSLTNPRSKAYKDVVFWYFVQFLLDAQMKAVHDHAKHRGVLLKGDIPIGVSRQGCDVWMEPRYFHMDGQAGAPPDDFAEDGQNWGFPTYNWDEMIRDNCQWWERRFRNMARYFDAYRIDHVLGFFRIWEIPMPAKSGLLGQFSPALALSAGEILRAGLPSSVIDAAPRVIDDNPQTADTLFLRDHRNPELYHPRILAQKTNQFSRLSNWEQQAFNRLYDDYFYRRNNQFWYEQAMKKLPRLVGATDMLCCAEDLGMVPDCVAWVMDELQILSLELESMPKNPGLRFGRISQNPYRSVCTISTHDTPTLRMWWDENQERTQDYWNNVLHRPGPAPHPMSGDLATDIIRRHLQCPSMICVISIQDWLAIDESLRLPDANAERVNIPANPRHYWRYRMHVNIEDLSKNSAFTGRIQSLVRGGNRQ